MALTGKTSISLKKKDLLNQKQVATGYKKSQFYHKATAGDTGINLLAMTMPPELSGLGFTQGTADELASAQIKLFRKNVTITSSARGTLMDGLSYAVGSNTQITFSTAFGTALANEVFIITVDANARTGFVGVDATSIQVSGVLLAGSTLFNVGRQFQVNLNPSSQIGMVAVWADGVLQMRNAGNATAAPSADGNYQELNAGSGWGSQIQFNSTSLSDRAIVVVSTGLSIVQPNGSLVQELETVNGRVDKLVEVTADLSGLADAYFGGTSNVDLKAFGDRVYNVENAAMTIAGLKTFSSGIQLPTTGGTATTLNYYQEDDATLAAVTWLPNGAGSTKGSSVAVKITRVGRIVTLRVAQCTDATSAGTTTFLTLVVHATSVAALLPTWARPPTTQYIPCAIYAAGAAVATPGFFLFDSSGLFIYKDPAHSGTFGNGTCGMYGISVSYSVV